MLEPLENYPQNGLLMDAEKEELMAALARLWERFPSMRLGQLICNLATFKRGDDVSATWDIEDDELRQTIEEWMEFPGEGNSK